MFGAYWLIAKTFLSKNLVVLALVGGVVVVIGSMWLRIGHLKDDKAELRVELLDAQAMLQYAAEVNTSNKEAFDMVLDNLELCIATNKALEESSQQAAAKFAEDLKVIRGKVRDETLRVRKALQNETCAIVAVPDDVGRVLRNGAARASGDS